MVVGLLIASFVIFLISAFFVAEPYKGRLIAVGLALMALAFALSTGKLI